MNYAHIIREVKLKEYVNFRTYSTCNEASIQIWKLQAKKGLAQDANLHT